MREDWIEVELGKVCEKAIKVKRKEMPLDKSLKYIDIGVVDNKTNKITGSKEYTWADAPSRAQQIIKKGDTLFSTVRTYLKNIAQVEKDEYTNEICSSGFTVLRGLTKILNSHYLFHYSLSIGFLNPLSKLQTGTSYPAVRDKDVFAQIILLPPLPIQRAIVSKIETLFSDLDNGIADLKKAQEQLKIYRQAVLSTSFSKKGKVEISKLVNELSQGWSPKCINQSSNDTNQWAVIKTSAIQASKFIEIENKILPETLEPREQHEIEKGDILITRAGPRVRVGICCLVRNTRPKLINCDKVYRLRLNKSLVNPEYFEYAMNSPEILSEIEVMKSGSSDSGLNLTQKVFLRLEIPVPKTLEEQHQIVREIESRLSVCDNLEFIIHNSLINSESLRQSILKKAFEGKLLSAAEIAQCKQEADYEPASVLLERIKKEKNK